MSRLLPTLLAALGLAVVGFSSSAHADDPLHIQVDRLIAKATPNFAKIAAEPSTDAEFFRRVHLDLAGKIPTPDETRAFLDDATPSAEKRSALIDRLLSSPQHARRMQYVFDEMLMERLPTPTGRDGAWQKYLRESFRDNKPWDDLVKEILAADGVDPKQQAAAGFYLDRAFKVDQVTRDVGRVFLGVDLECAQCHDHPAIDDYLQRHYFGITAFLKRSYLFTDPKTKKKVLGEKAEGDVTFTSVFTNESDKTAPRLLDMPEMPDPEGMEKQYITAPSKKDRGIPKYSRRLKLAEAMVADDNVAFRRNIVNRLWALMMGRGLVEPLDIIHSDNPPSHPEVLDLLADEFAKHDHDIRWFLRELALSQTYQRSSRLGQSKNDAAKQYAVGLLKPLSPEQLAWSLMEATDITDALLAKEEAALLKKDPMKGPAQVKDPRWREESLHKAGKTHVDAFILRFAPQGGQQTTFAATADQALFLSNGSLVQTWLTPSAVNLTGRLAKLEDPVALAEELYLSLLTRRPTEEEANDITAYLKTTDNRESAIRELAWALLSSAEFRFNH